MTLTSASELRVDVFTVGPDDAIWQKTYSPVAGWGNWVSIGGHATTVPEATTSPDGRIDVVAGARMRTYTPGTGQWGTWEPVDRDVTAPQVDPDPLLPWRQPAEAVISGDGSVWVTIPTALGWSFWESLGAPQPLYAPVHWYGENGSTCLQTGFPSTNSQLCSGGTVATLEGAVAADIAVTTSGRYCNHYNAGSQDACRAIGDDWSFRIQGGPDNGSCNAPYAPCGAHEYVSFAGQGSRNRPWSGLFASNPSPSLVVSARADPQLAVVGGGAWGYLCPILLDATTGQLVEYCFEQWRVGSGYPQIPGFDVVSACASASGRNVDQVVTQFGPDTRFASQRPGTASRYTFAPGSDPAPSTFGASISATELIRAVDAVNARCARGLSRNPADYALVGVENGIEGGNLTALSAGTSKLRLFTAR